MLVDTRKERSMPQELPGSIKAYFAGKSRNDIDAMLASFGEAAVVKDEGAIPLAVQTIESDSEGGSREWLQGRAFEVSEEYRLCRCGHSSNKPFCDSTHLKVRFDGTETASRAPYLEQAEVFEGPAMD